MSGLLNRQEKTKALGIAFCLSLLLFSFLPLTDFLYFKLVKPFLGQNDYFRLSLFPLCSLIVFLSLKPKWKWDLPGLRFLLFSTPLPMVISYCFGILSQWPERSGQDFFTYYWYIFCIPIGEEFLFRGWAFEVFERFFPKRTFTLIFAIPVSVWMTSIMFSLWHLQNLSENPPVLVFFQVLYTFFTGLWLAQIRLRCGNPVPCCIAHSLLNIAACLG